MNLTLNLLKYGATSLFSLGIAASSVEALTITPTSNSNNLVNTILGEGITVDSASINYIGANGASGTFTDGLSSGIGIDSGIILTTGSAANAEAPNDLDSTTTNNGFFGDTDLNNLPPGFFTRDATVLEFDFESDKGDLFFNYVFASEEYNEYTNSSFNDVFAFFLDGTNIALIPGTSTPVSINNVNGGNPFGNNASNAGFYNNNDPNDPGPSSFDIEYDGFTDVFTAQALGLAPGKHTIKLAIADVGDSILDSAVFIQAGSFSDDDDDGDGDGNKIPEPSFILGLFTFASLSSVLTLKKRKILN